MMKNDGKPCGLCCVTPWFPRVGFGLVLVGYGVNHYRGLSEFVTMASSPVGPLGPVAGLLAYIVPLLMIVGGVLFATKQLCGITKFCIYASLGGILGWAGVGLMFTSDPETIGFLGLAITNASVLLIAYYAIKKMCKKCCGACPCKGGSCCGGGESMEKKQ